MSPYRIVGAKCAVCGKEACGEYGTCVASGWRLAKEGSFVVYGAPGNRCPECARREKMREGKIVAFFAGLFLFAVGAVIAVSVFVCLVN